LRHITTVFSKAKEYMYSRIFYMCVCAHCGCIFCARQQAQDSCHLERRCCYKPAAFPNDFKGFFMQLTAKPLAALALTVTLSLAAIGNAWAQSPAPSRKSDCAGLAGNAKNICLSDVKAAQKAAKSSTKASTTAKPVVKPKKTTTKKVGPKKTTAKVTPKKVVPKGALPA
jgi:hypothetical protein